MKKFRISWFAVENMSKSNYANITDMIALDKYGTLIK